MFPIPDTVLRAIIHHTSEFPQEKVFSGVLKCCSPNGYEVDLNMAIGGLFWVQ